MVLKIGSEGAAFSTAVSAGDLGLLPHVVGLDNGTFDILWTNTDLSGLASFGGLFNATGTQYYTRPAFAGVTWVDAAQLSNGDLGFAEVVPNGTGARIDYFENSLNGSYDTNGTEYALVSSTTGDVNGLSVSNGANKAMAWYQQTGAGDEVLFQIGTGPAKVVGAPGAEVGDGSPTEVVQLTNGNYAVSWTNAGTEIVSVLDPSGNVLNSDLFSLSAHLASHLGFTPDVGMSATLDNKVAIVESYGGQVFFYLMDGQNYGVSGHLVSAASEMHDFAPAVTTLEDGQFVMAWYNSDSQSIEGQQLDSTGSPVNSPFQINTGSSSIQPYVSLASTSGNHFVVAWSTDDSSTAQVEYQQFSAQPASNDFGGDGKSDLFFQGSDGTVISWDMSDHTYSGYAFGALSSYWQFQKTGDFNGDGKSDILWRSTSGEVVTWSMNDHQYSGFDLGHVDTSWQVSGTGDFNGDGKSDILWRNTNGELVSWNMNNHTYTGVDYGRVDTTWSVTGTGDFNSDGNSDILWRNSNGDLTVWYMSANHTHTGFDFGKVDANFQVVGTGDFNGDGNTDILWRNTSTGDLISWDVKPDGSHTGFDFGVVDPAFKVVDVADYNGDGKSDIVWRSTSTGHVITWDMDDHTHTGFDYGAVSQSFHLLA
jgi:hypothetical protein